MTLVEVAEGVEIYVEDVGGGRPPVVLLAGLRPRPPGVDAKVRALGASSA
jgi:hypothetical protein